MTKYYEALKEINSLNMRERGKLKRLLQAKQEKQKHEKKIKVENRNANHVSLKIKSILPKKKLTAVSSQTIAKKRS